MITPLPGQVVKAMAQRSHRFHHYLWHRVRNSWLRFTESERRAVHEINPAWAPPRPAVDAMRRPIRDNDSGEDFLFMHRQMIALVNDILTQVNDPLYPRVEGWRRVPPPEDQDYPVPEFSDSELEEVKSVSYFEQFIEHWERQYKDPDYLRTVSLGQLGSDMEFTIHNDMHMRWAGPSTVGYRPPTSTLQDIDEQWDSPAYDYLGDTYSSHVNPIFWKIHGWVDDRIEDWKREHNIAGEIHWKGTWTGGGSHSHIHLHEDGLGPAEAVAPANLQEELRQIDRIISRSGASEVDGFFRPMAHNNPPMTSAIRRRIYAREG